MAPKKMQKKSVPVDPVKLAGAMYAAQHFATIAESSLNELGFGLPVNEMTKGVKSSIENLEQRLDEMRGIV